MKITTFALYDWDGNLIREDSYEYNGELALCDRGTSKEVAKQGIANSQQDQSNAQTALSADNSAITNYQNAVKTFAANNPYKIGGQFDTDQRTINADTSNAGTKSLADAMRLNATKTGQNAASYAPALAEAQRGASRDLATTEATADQKRIQQGAVYDQQATQMAAMTPDMYNRIYGTSVSGANGALGTAGSAAAASPSFGDQFGGAFAKALGTAAVYGAGAAAGG